jgi:hypothetical protein
MSDTLTAAKLAAIVRTAETLYLSTDNEKSFEALQAEVLNLVAVNESAASDLPDHAEPSDCGTCGWAQGKTCLSPNDYGPCGWRPKEPLSAPQPCPINAASIVVQNYRAMEAEIARLRKVRDAATALLFATASGMVVKDCHEDRALRAAIEETETP